MFKVLGMGAMATARIGSRVAGVAAREGIEGIGIAARAGAEGIGMAARGGGKALGVAVRGAGNIHMPTFGASDSDENKKKHWWSLSANIADNDNASAESAESAENETRDASVCAESETQDASDEDIDPLDGFKNHLSQDSGDNDLLDQIFLKAQPHLGLEPYQANVVDERLRRSIRA
jgi:hypothetical protein